jgi:SEC-C motif domain protein
MKCLCHSGKEHKQCCALFHEGKLPKSAVELMRSRYCAYALGNTEYIIETTHPNHIDQKIPIEQRKAQIEEFSRHTDFKNLEILDSSEEKEASFVTFHATLFQDGHDCSFIEKSRFEKIEGKLYYLNGVID